MFIYIIKIFSIVIFLLILIVLSFKIDKFYGTKKNKHTQVLDVIRLNKHNSIVTLKTGEGGVLLGVSPSNISKIKDISKDEIIKIEKDLEKNKDDLNKKINCINDKLNKKMNHIKDKIKQKKEGV